MLLQIRDYLRQEQTASNQQIARHFRIDIHALQPMLEFWVTKGVLVAHERSGKKNCQSGCLQCKPQSLIYYQYCQKK
ncbi:MAG: hypothetical protein H2069_00945 [Legionella sp.]|nr:hypothetical protein [Legionella sp.]